MPSKMVDYCHSCKESGIGTEAGHFIGPKSSFPLLTDKKGRPLCDFHWWLMFESLPSKGGMTWAEYTEKWGKPDYPKLTWPPEKVQTAGLKKLKQRR
ncbi:MAG: hypothetical protein ABSB56_05740 [Nitrososphaerales archaeon]